MAVDDMTPGQSWHRHGMKLTKDMSGEASVMRKTTEFRDANARLDHDKASSRPMNGISFIQQIWHSLLKHRAVEPSSPTRHTLAAGLRRRPSQWKPLDINSGF